MELNEFIKEVLADIFKGVKEAQDVSEEYNAYVNPVTEITTKIKDRRMNFQNVFFEVVLTKTEESENNAGIGVWFPGMGAGGKTKLDMSNTVVTNVKFHVPVSLPYMDNDNKPLEKTHNEPVNESSF